MDKFITYQTSIINSNIDKLGKLRYKLQDIITSKNISNIGDRLRVLNRNITIVNDNIINILADIDREDCIIDEKLRDEIEIENKKDIAISKLLPYLIYFNNIQQNIDM